MFSQQHVLVSRLLVTVGGALLCCLSLSLFAAEVTGSGAGSPSQLYAAWVDAYNQQQGGDRLAFNFASVGSGEGIRQIKAKAVDFAASDVPLTPAELERGGLVNFPVAISGVVPVVNLPGVKAGELRLTAKLIFDIYSGAITRWNSPAIADVNAGIRLPNLPIRVHGRSDGAGTTYHFAYYLSKASGEWKQKFGYDFKIQWTESTAKVGSVKEMVSAIQRTAGAIGYMEYGTAVLNNIAMVQLRNAAGTFVAPSFSTFHAALASSAWVTKGAFEEFLADMPGKHAWPITAGTYIIVPKAPAKPEKVHTVLKLFNWCFVNGDRYVESFGYMPLPERVQARAMKEIARVVDGSGNPLIFTAH